MNKKALITGASGFVGPYLARHLLECGYQVVAGTHPADSLPEGCQRVSLDVTDRQNLRSVLGEFSPDETYHLAGLTRPSGGVMEEFYRVNFHGALNLLESVREEAPNAAVLLVGSAYAYGRVDSLIRETTPLSPVNHYGVSKAAADMLGYSYALERLRVVRARPFNHSGPYQSPDFVLPSLVRQFAEIEAGQREPVIHLGNLEAVRDFSDVRGMVIGCRLALQEGRSGEAYNFGSGRGFSTRELYETICRETGIEAKLETEDARVRAQDIPYLVADVDKARGELGWETRLSLGQTIRDMFESSQRD